MIGNKGNKTEIIRKGIIPIKRNDICIIKIRYFITILQRERYKLLVFVSE